MLASLPVAGNKLTADEFAPALRSATEASLKDAVRELAIENLATTNADYNNLLKEYRDGNILL